MLKTHLQLVQELEGYSSPRAKITRMIKENEIIQIRRGIFLDKNDREYSLFSLSSLIYGPSYVSFQSAMSNYGLIPERTSSITCASFNKNKNKTFETPIGNFFYHYIPAKVYPYDILIREENDQNYLIASQEKALSDALYKVRDIENFAQLEDLLFEDWRIEPDDLKILDMESLSFLLPLYQSKVCNLFSDWLKENVYA
jgi:hypothetical protein